MKTPSLHFRRLIKAGTIAIFCILGLPQEAQAGGPHGDWHGRGNSSGQNKDKDKNKDKNKDKDNDKGQNNGHNNGKNQHKDIDRGGNDHDRRVYYISRPRSTFVLSLGNGYAGRGYYYGPPNSPYYYQRSEVAFYATREAAPRSYYSNSTEASVQQALASRGYYHGAIDGQIGANSRRAIYNYQRANGLRATGSINSSLLRSLGI